jgi:carboxypeptidase Q
VDAGSAVVSRDEGAGEGEVVYVPLTDAKELDALKGKLAGKIVLLGAMRPTPDITEPLFTRYTDEELKEMETYEAGGRLLAGRQPEMLKYIVRAHAGGGAAQAGAEDDGDEGVLAIITPSRDGGDGGGTGIIFDDNGANLARDAQKKENAVKIPNAVMMIEHYNRLARMVRASCAGDGGGEHRDEVYGRP